MRKVTKGLTSIPTRLVNVKAKKSLSTVLQTKDANKISGDVYKGIYKEAGKSKSEVRDVLNKFYYEKCGYCEMHNYPEVEHYRPKGRVTEDETHSGYYWLCYEWSNLLPSCHDCNAVNGKLNQFPILGVRVTGPPLQTNGDLDNAQCLAYLNPLLNERPYLLHPEIDEPKNFLAFEIDSNGKGIKIIGTDADGRGNKTISICDLNRDYVMLNRLEILDPIVKILNIAFQYFENGKIDENGLRMHFEIVFSQIDSDIADATKTHTLLRWHVFTNIDYFKKVILPYIAENARSIVLEAFKFFRNIP